MFKDSVESVKRVASFAGRLVGGGGGGQAGGGGRAYGMVQVERQREKSDTAISKIGSKTGRSSAI